MSCKHRIFIQLSSALSQVPLNNFTEFTTLNELLDPDLVSNTLSQAGFSTIIKCKLSMDKWSGRWLEGTFS